MGRHESIRATRLVALMEIETGLTFDDVLLTPAASDVVKRQVKNSAVRTARRIADMTPSLGWQRLRCSN